MTSHVPSKTEKGTFAFLFAAAAFFFLWTMSPIWVPLFLGVLIAVVAMPLQARLERKLPRHPRLAAALITLVTLSIGAGLVAFVAFVVVRELVRALSGGGAQHYLQVVMTWLHSRRATSWLSRFGETPEHLIERVREQLAGAATWLSSVLSSLVAVTSNGLLTLVLTAITSYYLLIEGRTLARFLLRLLPLPPEETHALMSEFRQACVAILLGIGVIGVYQGVAVSIGFWMFGVPKPWVLGAVTGVVSLLPAIGTGLTAVPVSIVLIARGHIVAGIGLLVYWLVVVVFVADYIIRPRIMEGRTGMHSLLVLASLFGGLGAFGPAGFFLGPLFCALFVSLLRIYERDYKPPPTTSSGTLIQTP